MSNIKVGFWRDYGKQGLQCTLSHYFAMTEYPTCCNAKTYLAYQYLAPEKKATTISNIIAVILTLALPRIYILLKRSMPNVIQFCKYLAQLSVPRWLCQVSKSLPQSIGATFGRKAPNASTQTLSLEIINQPDPGEGPERRIVTGLLDTIQHATTTESAVSQLARHHLAMPRITLRAGASTPNIFRRIWTNIIEEPRTSSYTLFFMLALFAIYIGLQAIAISSSFMVGDSAASITPAAYAYYINAGYRLQALDEIISFSAHHSYQSSLTESALSYAALCYQSAGPPTSCGMTLTRNIPYSILDDNLCPFPAHSMCKFGNDSTHTLDTGFIDAGILGINSASNFEFRRRTTCSPVLDDENFVRLRNVSKNVAEINYLYAGLSIFDSRSMLSERRHRDYNELLDSVSGHNDNVPDTFLNKAYDVR